MPQGKRKRYEGDVRGPDDGINVLVRIRPDVHHRLTIYARAMSLPIGWAVNDLLMGVQYDQIPVETRLANRYQKATEGATSWTGDPLKEAEEASPPEIVWELMKHGYQVGTGQSHN